MSKFGWKGERYEKKLTYSCRRTPRRAFLDRRGITLIRPLIYMPERYALGLSRRLELPVVENTCPADGNSKRQYTHDLAARLEKENPGLKKRLFTAVQNGLWKK